MGVKQKLRKYADERLNSYGYYMQEKTDSRMWQYYSRNEIPVPNVKFEPYVLTFQKSQYEQRLRTYITGSGFWGIKCISLEGLENEAWCYYDTEDELIEVIKQQVEIFISQGLEFIEEQKKHESPKPIIKCLTTEQSKRVLDNTELWARTFVEQTGFFAPSDFNEELKMVGEILKKKKSGDINKDEELIHEVTAYLGERIRKYLEAEWEWDTSKGEVNLVVTRGEYYRIFLQSYIIEFWNNLEPESILPFPDTLLWHISKNNIKNKKL